MLWQVHLYLWELKNLSTSRPVRWINTQHALDYIVEILGVTQRYPLELSSYYFLIQFGHVVRRKWRFQRSHLIEHAASAPNVAFCIVGLVLPHFGTGVVGRSRLRMEHCALRHLGHVEVPELDLLGPILRIDHDKQVGALDVSMHNVVVMESFQALDQLHQVNPQLLLRKIARVFLKFLNSLQDISTGAELHDKAKALGGIIVEALFVLNDIFMSENEKVKRLAKVEITIWILNWYY